MKNTTLAVLLISAVFAAGASGCKTNDGNVQSQTSQTIAQSEASPSIASKKGVSSPETLSLVQGIIKMPESLDKNLDQRSVILLLNEYTKSRHMDVGNEISWAQAELSEDRYSADAYLEAYTKYAVLIAVTQNGLSDEVAVVRKAVSTDLYLKLAEDLSRLRPVLADYRGAPADLIFFNFSAESKFVFALLSKYNALGDLEFSSNVPEATRYKVQKFAKKFCYLTSLLVGLPLAVRESFWGTLNAFVRLGSNSTLAKSALEKHSITDRYSAVLERFENLIQNSLECAENSLKANRYKRIDESCFSYRYETLLTAGSKVDVVWRSFEWQDQQARKAAESSSAFFF